MLRALASHQCGPGWNPGVDAICGLSLLLVLSFAPRGFSPGTPVFPSPKKPTFPNSNSTRNQVDKEPPCGYATCKSLFIYFYLFIHFSLDLVYLCSEKTDVRQPWTLKSWGGKLTLSTQLIKPEFMLRTLVDTTPTFIRNWTFSSGGSTRSSTHPGPKAMLTLYPNPNPNPPNPNPNPPKPNPPNPNPNYTGWLWRWHENFSLWANRTPNVAT